MTNWLSKHFTEKTWLWILGGIVIISTLIDMYTAFTSPAFELGESNPLFVIFGNTFLLIILNIFIMIFLIWMVRNGITLTAIFLFTMLLLYLSAGHFLGAYSNVMATESYNEDPEAFTERMMDVSPKDKIVNYSIVVGIFMVLPVVISTFAFIMSLYFFNKRKPKREKIYGKIRKLIEKVGD